MESYKKIYYEYQTQARGLLTENELLARFNKLAPWYGARLKPYLPADKNAKCLDVPCGYGNFLYFLKSKSYSNIQGIDLDNKQVELATMLGLPAREGDAFELLSDEAQSFDLISSLDFIEHLDKDGALQFLSLSYQRLKPGGLLLLRAPCGDGPFGAHDAWNDLTHEWGMTSNVLRTMLELTGFVDVKTLDERPQPTSFVDFIRWLIFFPARAMASAMCMALGMRPPTIWTRSMIAVAYKPGSGESAVAK
jgi:2-polyprenyl-3-methyl-5-hydroxy-6-metoxy-1,4-benzoquinol methylase